MSGRQSLRHPCGGVITLLLVSGRSVTTVTVPHRGGRQEGIEARLRRYGE